MINKYNYIDNILCKREREGDKDKREIHREKIADRDRQTEQLNNFQTLRKVVDFAIKREEGKRRRMRKKKKKGKNFTNFAKNRYETNCDPLCSLISIMKYRISQINFLVKARHRLRSVFFLAEYYSHLHNDDTIFVDLCRGIRFQVFLCLNNVKLIIE